MGGVLSSITSGLKTAHAALAALRSLSADFDSVLKRAHAAPGLPVPEPTAPYWLDDPPFPELTNIKSDVLPVQADVAIIGSGIAAAATARAILRDDARTGRSRKVVVLEARSLCSGATGRNGGHIKATPQEIFGRLRKTFGPEKAAELCRFQLRHLDVLTELCQAESIDVAECRAVETVDFFVDEASFESALKHLKELQTWVPEFEAKVWRGEEMRKVYHTRDVSILTMRAHPIFSQRYQVNELVIAATSYKAGALWPYRFVTSIWHELLGEFPKYLTIETHSPVESISVGSASSFPYVLHTSRGKIEARHVVHATNGFASQLLPCLRGKLLGMLAHMSSSRPGSKLADLNGSRSWSIMYGSFFDYVTQRPSEGGVPGDIMLGGGFGQSLKQGMDQLAVYDDSQVDVLTTAHNLGVMPTVFEPNWGPEAPGGKPRKVWTGIVAITADFAPVVGPLSQKLTGRRVTAQSYSTAEKGADGDVPTEWVAAGFCGDGMVWAWLSGTALGLMITGAENADLPAEPGRPAGRLVEWFPAALLPTEARIKKMDVTNLADELV
jgi:glycine/D-amino acid oxidase-like deaminating enzyme